MPSCLAWTGPSQFEFGVGGLEHVLDLLEVGVLWAAEDVTALQIAIHLAPQSPWRP